MLYKHLEAPEHKANLPSPPFVSHRKTPPNPKKQQKTPQNVLLSSVSC